MLDGTTGLTIFVGYDDREISSWHVAVESILSNASLPVSFVPLHLDLLKSEFNREWDNKQSNSFTYSRFLVPHLCGFKGFALFMDCDMLITRDVSELLELAKLDSSKAVHLVQHDYTPKTSKKYLGAAQYAYPRKNWSSFVLWNCAHPKCQIMTRDFVEKASAAELHRFMWLEDSEIGQLPIEWNWLVDECEPLDGDVLPNNIHWTNGGPWFQEYQNAPYSEVWENMLERVISCGGNPVYSLKCDK